MLRIQSETSRPPTVTLHTDATFKVMPTSTYCLLAALCVLSATNLPSEAARILVVLPSASHSHQVFFIPIVRELHRRGHHLTAITTTPLHDATLTNLTEIDVSFVFDLWRDDLKLSETERFTEGPQYQLLDDFMDISTKVSDAILSQPAVTALIHDKTAKFDLVLVEKLWYMSLYSFSVIFNCPLMGVISLGAVINTDFMMGNTLPSLFYTDMNVPFQHPMTIWEKMDSLYYNYRFIYKYYHETVPGEDRVARKHFGNDIPYVGDIDKSISAILINQHPAWTGVRNLVPGIIELGGMHNPPPKPLPQNLQDYLDNSPEGVIYFSLGSNVKSSQIGKHRQRILCDAFAKVPYKVLWKWEIDAMPGKPPNVITAKWFPQADILRHPNVKLIVTQGGLQSIEEAIHARLPMVGIPVFGDQHGNVRRLARLGIAKLHRINTLDADELSAAITEVITNPTYKQEVTKLAEILEDHPMPPLETAVWWVEHVIRHKGAAYLRSPARDIPIVEYFLLDVIGIVLGAFTIVLLVLIFVIRHVINTFRHQPKPKRNQKLKKR